MKYLVSLLFVFFAVNIVKAQNMVPNGSFESYTTCPTTYAAIANSTGWGQYIASPDYFNSCAGTALTSTPNNNWGWQMPANGNAYAGIVVFPNQTTREALGRNITPLTVGVRYEVSMSVSLANVSKYGINGLGAHFILNSTTAGSYTTAAAITPHVSYAGYGPINDTAGWARLVGTFVADSAYNYIAITGWGPYSSFTVDTVNPSGTFYAYYYIDSVVVRPVTGINNLYADTVACAGDTITVPYSLYRTYNIGNIFSVQLSNTTGSFATGTTIIGTSTNSSGNITCIIPRTITAGNNYRLRIVATSPVDTSDDNGKNIRIKPLPTGVLASSNAPICATDTLRLNGTSTTTGSIYSWQGVGGFASMAKDTFRAATTTAHSGNYILTVAKDGCVVKDTVSVLVKPRPATPVAGSNSPVCTGATISLTGNNSTPGVSYTWNGPAGFSSTSQSPARTGATTAYSGIYRVYTSLNGCASLMYDSVAVTVFPVTQKPIASANTPLCVGQDLQLGAGSIPGASYVWGGPGGFSSTLQNPLRSSATALFAGKYYVTATVNGCVSAADTVTVVINPTPAINMYPSPKDSICVGQSVTFVSSNSNAGSTYIRSWFRNNTVIGGAANANYSTATAADGDEYFVTLTAYGVCATPYTDTSNVVKMHVLQYLAPSVSIIANPNATVKSGTMINFTATPTNGGNKPAYQWTRNGAQVVGATSNVWGASTLSNNDQICVDMTSSYLCPNPKSAKSNCIKVSIESTGIVGVWNGKESNIYPNPAKENLIIEGIEKGTKIQLYDVVGRKVIETTSTAMTTELNMAHLVPGNYMLLLSKDNGDRMSVKVVKE